MNWEVYNGDCLEVMRGMESAFVDSVVCDPPYELNFMSKGWDRSGIAYNVEAWRECLRVLKPGGHLLAFGGSRTYHRLACAIEDAGFDIRDQIQWIYGSGFPKSLDVSKAIDARGPNATPFPEFARHYAERRKAAAMTHAQVCALGGFFGTVNHGGTSANWELGLALPTVKQWEVVAPILGLDPEWRVRVVREQYEREIVGSRAVHRGVAFTSDGPDELSVTIPNCDAAKQWNGWGTALKPAHEPIVLARKPLIGTVAQNILAHGTGGLNIDGCRIEAVDERSGGFGNGNRPWITGDIGANTSTVGPELGRWPANVIHDGSEEVLAGFPNVHGAGAQRNGGESDQDGQGGIFGVGNHDGNGMRFGDSGSAARFFYCAKASRKERGDGNNHPTVKPIKLMRYLCRLVTPPNGVVLDPFCGSGSTGVAASREGFRFVGIDQDADYCELSRKRIQSKRSLFEAVA